MHYTLGECWCFVQYIDADEGKENALTTPRGPFALCLQGIVFKSVHPRKKFHKLLCCPRKIHNVSAIHLRCSLDNSESSTF